MPSSTRPTGIFKVDMYNMIDNEFRLVDTGNFQNLI